MAKQRSIFLWLGLLAVGLVALMGCGGDDDEGEEAEGGKTITFVWGAEPPSLDPGLATDTTSANILYNIMDPLVVLTGADLKATPRLASNWTASKDGTVYTINIREDGKWTNGDPVTANDFVYSWKRTLSPELGADYAYQLYGIKGALEYNECKKNCEALKEEVGVEAVDDRTLKVTLTSAQPWFPQLLAHHSFLALHQPTVEKFGEKWTEPQNIVTNGPYKLSRWAHSSAIDIAKWPEWRDADSVKIERVNGRIITEGTTAVQAFEAGEVDALDGGLIPSQEMSRWKEDPAFYESPTIATYYYGFNLKQVPDLNQRRAMSLAIDRQTIVDRITQGGEIPATGFTPQGIAGFDTINPDSPWAPAEGDLDQAKQLLAKAQDPVKNVTLLHNNSPGHKEIAVAIQAMWSKLGIKTTIKQQEWAQFLEFLGPPPHESVDVFRNGWVYDYPDAMNGLELFTCDSGNNNTNWCNTDFDALVDKARKTPDNPQRYEIYRQLEDTMFGQNGDLPLTPIYWYVNNTLVNERLRDTFEIDSQTFIKFYEMDVAE